MNNENIYRGQFPPEVLKALKEANAVVIQPREELVTRHAETVTQRQAIRPGRSKYTPHQGARELARRKRQAA